MLQGETMEELRYCSKCVTPNTRPRIEFDEEGVCNACRYAEEKKNTDWEAKTKELKAIVDQHRSKDVGRYDCIIPVSGGKDSHFQAYYAKNVLKLNPLCVTFMPAIPTEIGIKNRRNLSEKIGVDHYMITPNPQVHAKLSKIMFREHGNPFLPWILGIFSAVTQVAVEQKISLILYGENGEVEYGGATRSKEAKSLDEGGIALRVKSDRHNWKDSKNWDKYGFSKNELLPYILPSDEEQKKVGIKRLFIGDYYPWNNNHNLYMALNVIGGFSLLERRTVGTYTHGASIDDDLDEVYLWFLWVKFGFGRASKSASPDIREGKLTREKAIELVKKYDGEFPWYIFDKVLEYLGMDEQEFWGVTKRFVGDKENIEREQKEALEAGVPKDQIPRRVPAWQTIGDGKWRHIQTVHGEERILEIPLKRPDDISPRP